MLWILSALAAPVRVALTFDDLPSQTLAPGQPAVTSADEQLRITDAMLGALAKHSAAASVFVNCGLLADDTVVQRWHDAGHDLANHTATHIRASAVPLDVWKSEVRSCHERLTAIAGRTPRWFRYPYLRRGEHELRVQGAKYLSELGEAVAPVTAATADWRISQLYDEARTPERKDALRKLLVEHVLDSVEAARTQVRERHHLEVPHIVLLHVNQLEADTLDDLLAAMHGAGLEVVPLSDVMKHPFYARADAQPADLSLPWQLRVAPTWKKGEENWFWTAEAGIEQRAAELPP